MSSEIRHFSPLPKRQRRETSASAPLSPVISALDSKPDEEVNATGSRRRTGDGSSSGDEEVEEPEIDDHQLLDKTDATSMNHEYREGEAGYEGLASFSERIHPNDSSDHSAPVVSPEETLFLSEQSVFGQAGIQALKVDRDEFKELFKGLMPPASTLQDSEPDDEGYLQSKLRIHAAEDGGEGSFANDGMGNKKKRKIPGVIQARNRHESSDEADRIELGEEDYELPDVQQVQTFVDNLVIKGSLYLSRLTFYHLSILYDPF